MKKSRIQDAMLNSDAHLAMEMWKANCSYIPIRPDYDGGEIYSLPN